MESSNDVCSAAVIIEGTEARPDGFRLFMYCSEAVRLHSLDPSVWFVNSVAKTSVLGIAFVIGMVLSTVSTGMSESHNSILSPLFVELDLEGEAFFGS